MEAENKTLWDEASLQLNWDRFAEAYRDIRNSDYRESEKVALIRAACDPVNVSVSPEEAAPELAPTTV